MDRGHCVGCTALWWAIADDHIEAARVLLYEGGADHAIADKEGEAPLAIARQFSNGECLRLLQVRAGTRVCHPAHNAYHALDFGY